jgi:hypothetical protein
LSNWPASWADEEVEKPRAAKKRQMAMMKVVFFIETPVFEVFVQTR